MTVTKRTVLVMVGLSLFIATYLAGIFIPVGECIADAPDAGCRAIQPWAAILSVAIPLGVLAGSGSVLMGLLAGRRSAATPRGRG